jgi:uncharacterized protein (DUF305 family)
MELKICGKTIDIPDNATDEEKDRLLRQFAKDVVKDIPKDVIEDMCDDAWEAAFGEVSDRRKKKQEEEAKMLKKHTEAGSGYVVLSEDDMDAMKEVLKADKEYEARKKREREEKDK